MKFPDQWPNDCPPADAEDAKGVVFRIVKNAPPTPKDFQTHFETGRMPKAPPCLRCGLSVFRELRDAMHQRELLPKLGKLIAEGTLQPANGKTKRTSGRQPSHTTWWAFEGVNRSDPFSVMNEEE